jgi:uncharacterized protein involved in exopolysaccharide biosynthesis
MNETQNQEQEKSAEERFKETVDKLRPFIKKFWASRWKLVYINGGVIVVTVLILLFLIKPYYDSSVVILPDLGNNGISSVLSQFSGLASLAGVNVGQSDPSAIYESLVKSEAILEPVVYHKYNTKEFNHPVNLIEYFEIDPDKSLPDSLQPRQMFLDLLKKLDDNRISTDVDRTTSILTITVRMPESRLSADVANEIAESLNNYVVEQSSFKAKEERKYLQKRVSDVKDSLAIAEDNLKKFSELNRIAQSPQLLLEQARLTRIVEIKQALYIELVKQYEIAKLNELNDTPVINIREKAKGPVKKTGPKRSLIFILVMFFSFSLVCLYIAFEGTIKRCYLYLREENK